MMTMVYDANADPILQEAEAEAVMRACVLANQVIDTINIILTVAGDSSGNHAS